ncbi:ankyrin repeat domain-containing protein [Colletotrichum musicola]|uniref:Ankyrin repeat domain-containing protein n=1 Tax=Colletotrichum musicola TaxID=2175873 RepID=A0A8H6JMK4_9PEZI|nr:ankyrin repeat domain-containing protein [Colletotrichum musicola]
MAAATNLWDKAFQSLSPDLQASLNASKTPRRDIWRAVLKVAEEKRAMALRKGWKFTKRNGEVVLVRDLLEKIVDWVNRFKATGDTIVQHDPEHAALPWAAVRFLLQIAVSEVELFGALANDCKMMVRYRAFEGVYLRGSQSEVERTLGDCLVRLYAEVLTQLSYALVERLLKSPFRAVDRERENILRAREEEVNAFAKMVDAETLRACETALVRLSIQNTRELTEEKYNDIVEWLSVTRYRDHHKLLAQSRSRLPDAGQWLLGHSEYRSWQNTSSSSLLLVHGIPGAGKSTLTSVVVDALLEAAATTPDLAPFGYFYCANPESEKARRSIDDVMRTVLFQLAIDTAQKNAVREFVCDEYDQQMLMARAGKLDLPKLTTKDCVRLILELAQQDPITIILDGLDSVDDTERHTLILALRDIISKADNIVKIFVTSRTSGRAAAVPEAEFKIHITSQETHSDMEAFVDHLIDDVMANRRLLEGSVSLETRVMLRQGLISGAGEMFLWAKLKLERLVHETVEDDVLVALQSEVPKDIDQLYQQFLSHILSLGASARNIATKAFSWILFMREPLTPAALLTALSAGESAPWTMSQVMATCSAFIVLDNTCDVLRFVHQSAQDFLMRHPMFAAAEAHTILASSCIEACCRGSSLEVNVSIPFRLPIDNFSHCAALYWPCHAELSEKDDSAVRSSAAAGEITRRVQAFIFDEDWGPAWPFEHWVKCVQSLASGLSRYHPVLPFLAAIPNKDSSFLFLLSMLGMKDILASSLSCVEGVDVNDRNEPGHTPVYLAASFGHTETITLLVAHGAKINVDCGTYGSPLHVACFRGHLAAVKQLLCSGAQQSCGSVFKHALEAAFRVGREDVALHIVSETSDIDGDDYQEALWEASYKGFFSVVQHLQRLQQPAPTKEKSARTRQRIRKAIQAGDEGVLCSLLRFSGLDANLAESLPSDAVALATLHNRKSMVEFLIDQGLSPEVEGVLGSPLRAASLLNFQSIVRVLLAKGAQAGAIGKFGDALHAAASNGHTAILKLLIQEGVDITQSSGYFRLPIQAAAYYGHTDIVEALLDANAPIDQVGFFDNAIEAAAKGGHHKVIELILRKRPSKPERPNIRPLQPILNIPPTLFSPSLCPEVGGGTSRLQLMLRAFALDEQRSKRDEHARCREDSASRFKERMPAVDKKSILRSIRADEEIAEFNPENQRNATVFSGRYASEKGKEHSPLIEAASSGSTETVSWLLKWYRKELPPSNTLISQAILTAAENGHMSVVKDILVFIANDPGDTAHPNSRSVPFDADMALDIIVEHCSRDDYAALGDMFCGMAGKYSLRVVPRGELLRDFAIVCKLGNVRLASAVLGSCHHQMLSASVVDGALQLCALYGHAELITFILVFPALQKLLPLSGEETLVTAAAGGAVELMRIVAQCWEPLRYCRQALGRALTVAGEHDHLPVVQYLVLELAADVKALSPDVGYSRVDINCEPARNPALNTRLISPLQAALRGFPNGYGLGEEEGPESTKTRAKQFHQERVIAFLLEKGSDPNDLGGQCMAPIQRAAVSCSPLTLDLLISAGADVNATGHGNPHSTEYSMFKWSGMASNFSRGAIYQAVGRERTGCLVLQRLLAAGAELPEDDEQQKCLIGSIFGYFNEKLYDSKVPTVEEIFSEGIGASLLLLLPRLPQIRTSGARWGPILQIAACLDDAQSVELLVSRGTDVNISEYYLGSALQGAARHGHLSMVQRLLDGGARVNQTGGAFGTAMRAAIRGGHREVFQLLASHGADLKIAYGGSRHNHEHEILDTLQSAVQTQSLELVQEVIAAGADPTLETRAGTQHPLIFAVNAGSVGMVGSLLGAGAPVNVRGEREMSAEKASAIHASSLKGHMDILDLLLQFGADVELHIDGLGTPLAVAASEGHVEVMQRLFSVGTRASDKKALTGAIGADKTEAVKLLLASGAKANNDDLFMACHLHHLDIIELLLDQACGDEALEDFFDQVYSIEGLSGPVARLLLEFTSPTTSQFLQVCATGSAACVELLLQDHSIDVNGRAKESGDYPLQVAAVHLQADVVKILVRHGADVDCQTLDHGTPLIRSLEACAGIMLRLLNGKGTREVLEQISLPEVSGIDKLWLIEAELSSYRCRHIVESLITHRPSVLQSQSLLGPPLHLACLAGDVPLVELVLKHDGRDPFTTAGPFQNALFAAIRGACPNVIELLLQGASAAQLEKVHPEYGTALHFACALRNERVAALLLQHGADATIYDTQNRTPLTVAIQEELKAPWPGVSGYDNSLKVLISRAQALLVQLDDLLAAVDVDCRRSEFYVHNPEQTLLEILRHDNITFAIGHHTTMEALEFVLEHRPEMLVTSEMVSHILMQGKFAATALLVLMQAKGKHVTFTEEIRAAIDTIYWLESDRDIRDQFLELEEPGLYPWLGFGLPWQ